MNILIEAWRSYLGRKYIDVGVEDKDDDEQLLLCLRFPFVATELDE